MGTVAIVGAGAIGIVLADAAALAGHQVLLCGRNAPEHLTVMRDEIVRTTTVRRCRDPHEAAPVDLVVVAVKKQDSGALEEWSGLIGEDTRVVLAQNGVDPSPLLVGRHRVMPSVVHLGATRLAPGVVLRTRSGRIVVPPQGALLRGYLAADAVCVEVSDDFRAEQWRKFAVNVCAGGLTTLFDRGFEIFRDPFVRVIARTLLDEVVAVAAAEGVRLDGDLAEQVIDDLATRPYGGTTSMLRDSRAGRALELDAHSAGLVRIAQRYNVAVPVNARLVTALAGRTRYPELVQ